MGYSLSLIFMIVLTTSISCMASDQAVSAKDLTYITEQYPPYNYQEDGKLQGMSVDLLEKIWERMGVNLNRSVIKHLPWTEGYEKTLKENNTVLFTTFRLPEREQLFKWVGPVASGSDVLLAKIDKNISIDEKEDLRKIKIGAIEDDCAVQRLLNNGVKKEDLILETTSTPIIEMLMNGTIDAWAYNNLAGIWLIQQSGQNTSDYKVAYVLAQSDGYYAFNKETPDSIVRFFQQALDYIKNNKDANGVSGHDKILAEYIPAMYIFAYDYEGRTLALPYQPELIGTSRIDAQDLNGVDFIQQAIDTARMGNGSTYYIYSDPSRNMTQALKLSYVVNVDDTWFLGSGIYAKGDDK
jgi:polar amino acid transport system substrate-binding protein